MNIREKSAFLKGLIEGSDLNFGEKEKKVVDALMDLLTSMVEKMGEVDGSLSQLYDGFDAISDSLEEIEEELDGLFDIDMDDSDFDGENEDEGFLYDVECPKCKELISVDEETLFAGGISCPGCGEKLDVDIGCDCEDCVRDKE